MCVSERVAQSKANLPSTMCCTLPSLYTARSRLTVAPPGKGSIFLYFNCSPSRHCCRMKRSTIARPCRDSYPPLMLGGVDRCRSVDMSMSTAGDMTSLKRPVSCLFQAAMKVRTLARASPGPHAFMGEVEAAFALLWEAAELVPPPRVEPLVQAAGTHVSAASTTRTMAVFVTN